MRKQQALQPGSEHEISSAGEVLAAQFTMRAYELSMLITALSESDAFDAEQLRQCRTAVRRLRCGLDTCSEGIAPDAAKQLSTTLKNFAEPLGIVRDFDVMYALISGTLLSWNLNQDQAGAEMLRHLANEGQDASDVLESHFGSPGAERCLAELEVFANDVPLKGKVAKQDADRYFLRTSRRAWHKLEDDVAALKKNYSDKQLHQLRVKVKATRYTFQSAAAAIQSAAASTNHEGAPDGSKEAKRHARRLGKLQDVLGAHQDCSVAVAWLRTYVARSDDPKSAALARQVIVDLQHQMEEHRAGWRKFWNDAKAKPATKWLND
jgi:CHAD domain-containing protein